jgi:hypothetical protein
MELKTSSGIKRFEIFQKQDIKEIAGLIKEENKLSDDVMKAIEYFARKQL